MIISILVAMNEELLIGVNNDLPWKLQDDLEHFKNYSLNKPIIMGRKTYESIGRPLPNRINYVVSKTIDQIEGAHVFTSTESAINNAKDYCIKNSLNEIVVIGGGFLFRDTLSVTNKLVLTRVDCDIDGDVFYPEIDLSNWLEKDSISFSKDADNDYDFIVSTYEKVK